jgi:hypothetical protein
MNQSAENKSYRNILVFGAVVLMLVVVVGIWLIARPNKSSINNPALTSSSSSTSGTDVKSLVSYTLPDAWTENSCPSSSNTVYVSPNGTSLDCSANPSAPVKVYVDPQNTTDCQQLNPANTQGIKKHVCISLYIGGHKSLKASTTYSSGSSYNTDTTISDYYINTGKGVVAIEYTYTSANNYQVGFDQLAMSVKVNS